LLVSAGAPSVLELVLSRDGYAVMFGIAAVLPALAIWTLPVAQERLLARSGR
jgi:hypothetical protein